mmetsp:Transcript_51527/g.115946  ORF Transcript_51527/g.115946 Transcript_51527/m.115946 type:complete len:204 (+) Transcript_51527:681-1292(+)
MDNACAGCCGSNTPSIVHSEEVLGEHAVPDAREEHLVQERIEVHEIVEHHLQLGISFLEHVNDLVVATNQATQLNSKLLRAALVLDGRAVHQGVKCVVEEPEYLVESCVAEDHKRKLHEVREPVGQAHRQLLPYPDCMLHVLVIGHGRRPGEQLLDRDGLHRPPCMALDAAYRSRQHLHPTGMAARRPARVREQPPPPASQPT